MGPRPLGWWWGTLTHFPRQIGLVCGPAAIPPWPWGKQLGTQDPPRSCPSGPGKRSGPLQSPLQPFPFLAPGCTSYTYAKPESGVMPSWGHLSLQFPQSLQKLGEGGGLSEAGMPGFLPRTCWNWASAALTPSLSPTDMISVRSGGGRPGSGPQLGTGRGTLRLRSRGPATVEDLVSCSSWAPAPLPCEIHRRPHHLLVEGLWALDANPPLPRPSSGTFLGQVDLSFLICKMGIVILTLSRLSRG